MSIREKSIQLLPPGVKEDAPEIPSSVSIRPVEEIVHRAVALFIVSSYADGILQQNCSVEESQKFINKFITRYHAEEYFSSDETEFLETKEPLALAGQMAWKWEALYPLLWILGFISDEMILPTKASESFLCSRHFSRNRTTEALLAAAKLRTQEQILQLYDITICAKHHSGVGLEPAAVDFWYKSLNWVTDSTINW